jgi:hypothetical protein
VPLEEFTIKEEKLLKVQNQLENLVKNNYYLARAAKEAYRSYLQAYSSHSHKYIFDVYNLDLSKLARCFGFDQPPKCDLALKMMGKKVQKRSHNNNNDDGDDNNNNNNDDDNNNIQNQSGVENESENGEEEKKKEKKEKKKEEKDDDDDEGDVDDEVKKLLYGGENMKRKRKREKVKKSDESDGIKRYRGENENDDESGVGRRGSNRIPVTNAQWRSKKEINMRKRKGVIGNNHGFSAENPYGKKKVGDKRQFVM